MSGESKRQQTSTVGNALHHLLDLFSPPAIRRSPENADFKLFAKMLWMKSGCCLLPIEINPRFVAALGFVDIARLLKKWLRTLDEIGWADVESLDRKWWSVCFRDAIFGLENEQRNDGRQMLLPFDKPSAIIGENPEVVQVILPKRLLEDDEIPSAEKFFALYVMGKGGLGSWQVEIIYERDRTELGRADAKSIRDYLTRLESAGYFGVERSRRGRSVVTIDKSCWLPGQVRRLEWLASKDFAAMNRLLPLLPLGSGASDAYHPDSAAKPGYGSATAPIPAAQTGVTIAHRPDSETKPGYGSATAPIPAGQTGVTITHRPDSQPKPGHGSGTAPVFDDQTGVTRAQGSDSGIRPSTNNVEERPQMSSSQQLAARIAELEKSPPDGYKNPRNKNLPTPPPSQPRTQYSAPENAHVASERPISDAIFEYFNDPSVLDKIRREQEQYWKNRIGDVVSRKERECGITDTDDRRLKPQALCELAQAVVKCDSDIEDDVERLLTSLSEKNGFAKSPAAWLVGSFRRRNWLPIS